MTKYKNGDKVRVTNVDYNYYNIGDVVTLTGRDFECDDGDDLAWFCRGGLLQTLCESEFELVANGEAK